MTHCPTCHKSVAPRAENPSFPFCTERCRLIDLGRWLGEAYRIPVRREETEDELPLPVSDEDHAGRD